MSHSDFDHKMSADLAAMFNTLPKTGSRVDTLAALAARAERKTERGENRITAGQPGEPCLAEAKVDGVLIRKLPDDPACLRISIGRTTFEPASDGTYCVFRGDRANVITVLERVLEAVKAADDIPLRVA